MIFDMKKYILILMIILLAGGLFLARAVKQALEQNATPTSSPTQAVESPELSPTITANPNALALPVADFKARVTKKPFGIYITPQSSPAQPERFSGFHTGADAEYEDATIDVPVFAVADGTVVLSKTATGYGGVFVIEIQLNGKAHSVLYGHIRPSSLPKVGTQVTKGEQLAFLGTGFSAETDNERRHLHFAVLATNVLDIRGYVPAQSQLSGWIDPLTFY